ncbi:MAG: hypothetical protein ACI845_001934 [Gammaproteobacteria bacterium]|jgi:hypothetical protein
MADNNSVDSTGLLDDIRQKVNQQQTGLYSIATDQNFSVLIGLTRGKVTRLHCRRLPPQGVIDVLKNSLTYRMRFMPASEDTDSVIMSGPKFIEDLESTSPTVETDDQPDHTVLMFDGETAPSTLRPRLIEIASEYIGMAAEILVEDAYQNHRDSASIVRFVRDGMLDAISSEKFDEDVRNLLEMTEIDLS